MRLTAFVFVDVAPGKSKAVARAAMKIKGVKLAYPVTGPYDVIVLAEAEDMRDLGDLVISKIQELPGVDQTLTNLVME